MHYSQIIGKTKGVRSCHSVVVLLINKLPSEHKKDASVSKQMKPFALFLFVLSTALVPHIQLFEQRGLMFSWDQLYSPAVCCHCRAAKEPSQGHIWQGTALMSVHVSGKSSWCFPKCGFGQIRASAVSSLVISKWMLMFTLGHCTSSLYK